MLFPSPETIATWRREWTDRYVRVKPNLRPELTRFEGRIGRVVTINYSGRAILDFADGAWYDLADFAAVLETVAEDADKQKYDATANSAQKQPARQG
jgi:hypothetical protein